jgi:SAM-dependent methyltransferase
MDLKEEDLLGNAAGEHWYYRAKAAALLRDLGGLTARRVLDIGAGSGFFSRFLLARAVAESAMCVDIGYTQDRDEICNGKPLQFRRAVAENGADLVLAMDVMEHVADEEALMRPVIDAVASGTRFVVTVPAFRFLWSDHDVFLGHYRRYTLTEIETTLRRCGLSVDWGHYYYAAVFAPAAAVRLMGRLRRRRAAPKSQLRKHSVLTNAVLTGLCALERPIMRFNRLFGLTAVAGARKP